MVDNWLKPNDVKQRILSVTAKNWGQCFDNSKYIEKKNLENASL
jgi:hypothetical protein